MFNSKIKKFYNIVLNLAPQLWKFLKKDFQYTWYYIYNIFRIRKNNILEDLCFVILFFILIPVMFIYLIYLFIMCSLWCFYYTVCYFLYKYTKTTICMTVNLDIYHFLEKYFFGYYSMGNPLLFIWEFLYYQPKILSFNYFYSILKLKQNPEAWQFFIFIIIILPFRILIKLLTGFSYLSIKVSAEITHKISEVFSLDWDVETWYKELLEGSLQSIYERYFVNLYCDTKRLKIFLNYNGQPLQLNPYWYNFFFKELPSLTKSMILSKDNIDIKWVKIHDSKFHPGILFTDKKSAVSCVSVQSSARYTELKFKEQQYLYKSILHIKEGVLGKKNVWDYNCISANKSDEVIFLKKFDLYKLDKDLLDRNKMYFFKTILLSLFNNDVVLNKEGVIENNDFNNFYERLLFLYNNKELDSRFKELFEYVNFFFGENFHEIDKNLLNHKINVFNYMVENTDIIDNNILKPFSENYYNPSEEVKISLNYLDIKL